jgi:hypothetical protein
MKCASVENLLALKISGPLNDEIRDKFCTLNKEK